MPRRFRRPRLLVVGCGDIGLRVARLLLATRPGGWRVIGTTRRPEQAARLRELGALPLSIDLDTRHGPKRLRGLSRWMVMLAPPPGHGRDDPRTARLIASLRGRRSRSTGGQPREASMAAPSFPPARWIYAGTTGVYGDCAGARFDETRAIRPLSARAIRRAAAEARLRRAGRPCHGAPPSPRITLMRVPGIYGGNRLPVERLRRGDPAPLFEQDIYTNHIHAEDLAASLLAALWRGRGNRVVHVVDDTEMKMGDYFDRVADTLGLPRPPRLGRTEIESRLSPAALSFLSESRRLANDRLKRELRARLRYPTVESGLAEACRGRALHASL